MNNDNSLTQIAKPGFVFACDSAFLNNDISRMTQCIFSCDLEFNILNFSCINFELFNQLIFVFCIISLTNFLAEVTVYAKQINNFLKNLDVLIIWIEKMLLQNTKLLLLKFQNIMSNTRNILIYDN